MIPFQKNYGLEEACPQLDEVLASGWTQSDGAMSRRCQNLLAAKLAAANIEMMTSCTHALEESMQVIGLKPGDEVVIPSFSFPSAANAVLLAGGTIVYAEVEPMHLTLDPERLLCHLTERTRAMIVVHYGGISCDMDQIMAIAKTRGILVIEDCAQSFQTRYKGRYTGTIGQFGCFSFHGTKDVVAGEGGALALNDSRYADAVSKFRQKGTDRDDFLRGLATRYEWVSIGSSHAPGELQMALLASQLELADIVVQKRRTLFRRYARHFELVAGLPVYAGRLQGFSKPETGVAENGHLFYLLFSDPEDAAGMIRRLCESGIEARTHFVPLHESSFGRQFIRPENDFRVEQNIGRRLVRLPLFAEMTKMEQDQVLLAVDNYFRGNRP